MKTTKPFTIPVKDPKTKETVYLTYWQLKEYVQNGEALPHEKEICTELAVIFEAPVNPLSLFAYA